MLQGSTSNQLCVYQFEALSISEKRFSPAAMDIFWTHRRGLTLIYRGKYLFFGAPGGIRTPNPQIRRSIRFSLVSSRHDFFSSFSLSSPLPFISFRLVFYQSGSNVVASQPRELRLNPQICNLLPVENVSECNWLVATVSTMFPSVALT